MICRGKPLRKLSSNAKYKTLTENELLEGCIFVLKFLADAYEVNWYNFESLIFVIELKRQTKYFISYC